ncbi:sensor histidine kinase [Bacillus sp. BRMEA1]|nr:sensor histidine kinase [Neobacillus endophyticus]NRD78947.1 sensor histidine kinase [Neobacillus endophyticus]
MIIIVPIAGEINFYPVNATFRISFGVPAFLFFLLLFRNFPVVIPGFLTALNIVGIRILIEFIMNRHFLWTSSFHSNFSSFFFYLAYVCFFYFGKVHRFYHQLLLIGLFGILIEIAADLVELTVQYFFLGSTFRLGALNEILIMAISHSFIVLSFFTIMRLYEAQERERQIRKQNERMLLLISNLYEESIHLKKTLINAENITKKSYDLYKSLNDIKNKGAFIDSIEEFGRKALMIAGEVHEIKKDNQRIFAGISKLISVESFGDYINLHELIAIVKRTNEKYADLLKKEIEIKYFINGDHPDYHVFTLLSIINNIVTNAVEAIEDSGTITINIKRDLHSIEFQIADTGPGILPKHKNLIYKPGFTSKYDTSGNPSTGMGLSFVKDMVEQLEGDISVEDQANGPGAVFIIRIPIIHLMKRG